MCCSPVPPRQPRGLRWPLIGRQPPRPGARRRVVPRITWSSAVQSLSSLSRLPSLSRFSISRSLVDANTVPWVPSIVRSLQQSGPNRTDCPALQNPLHWSTFNRPRAAHPGRPDPPWVPAGLHGPCPIVNSTGRSLCLVCLGGRSTVVALAVP